ncbi:preprotein translocase subunit SecE [Candidatus Berkelbacteria bacterium]|nr:preprotein translocase subunit SecE [Candidatus Berkelbacteria bacterium]
MNPITQSVGYLTGVTAEFRKVSFPSRRDVAIHTIVVVSAIVIMVGFLTVVDGVFAFLVKLLLTNV